MGADSQVEIFIIGLHEQVPRAFWMTLVKRRANFKCERCDNKEDLVAHHKDSNKENNCLDNGECLCRSCHTKKHWEDEEHRSNRIEAIALGKSLSTKETRDGYEGWMNKTAEERSEAVKKSWVTRKQGRVL